MTWTSRDRLHRTAKQLLDSGRATNPTEARQILEDFVLQVAVGPDIDDDVAAQAALLTIINAGHRAFLGGVRVYIDDNPTLGLPWAAGESLTDAITRFGGRVVDQLNPRHPTLVIGDPHHEQVGELVLHATWRGWSGGIVESRDYRLAGPAMPLAGVLAGALGVSEAFQHLVGSPVAGRRDVGVSLWRPELGWRDPAAAGPTLAYLPTGLWLLGLGHLGQAYAWALGCLPYATPADLTVYLLDFDTVVDGNHATGLLTNADDVDRRKTRVVADRLEALGHRTAIVERRFDDTTRPDEHEPAVAIAGFDDPAPRRLLGGRFDRVVDAGLGAGHVEYLDMLVHTFPSPLDPAAAFPDRTQTSRPLGAPYNAEIQRLIDDGTDPGDARCGMLNLAGVSVGAAFVGATAAALVIADLLRLLHGGCDYSVLALDLRSPGHLSAAINSLPGGPTNPGFTNAR